MSFLSEEKNMKYSINAVGSSYVENSCGEIDVIDDRMNELVDGGPDSDFDFWSEGEGFEWLVSVEKTGGEWVGEGYELKVEV